MSEMLEQVAKAMWDARRAHANNSGVELELWGDGTIPKANGIMDEARAAIEAMIDPTDNMLIRGSAAAEVCDDGWETNATWMAMINAAVDGQAH